MSDAIRILHVLGGVGLGGAESRIMDLYRTIDRGNVQFDFLIHTTEQGYYYEEIKRLGGNIYVVPRFQGYNLVSYRKAIKDFFELHSDYRAVHGHMTSTASVYLPIAKKAGISITIAHARSAGVDKGLKGALTKFMRKNLKNQTDFCFACSKLAGEAVFGTDKVKKGEVVILPNAVEAGKYTYDSSVRNHVRKELQVEDKFVVGHVGRFGHMKNHTFLLDVFYEISKKRENAVLMLLGEGSLMSEIQDKANRLGLEKKVLFLGNHGNIEDYYQAMDFFVFPSLFEGLPGTVVEAQASGLQCLISDQITPEVVISPLVQVYSIKEDAGIWCDYVLSHANYQREDTGHFLREAGFDVRKQAEKLLQFYQKANPDVFCRED